MASMEPKFRDANAKSDGLSRTLEHIPHDNACQFFDADSVISTSKVNGVHLDEDQHLTSGNTFAEITGTLLQSDQ